MILKSLQHVFCFVLTLCLEISLFFLSFFLSLSFVCLFMTRFTTILFSKKEEEVFLVVKKRTYAVSMLIY